MSDASTPGAPRAKTSLHKADARTKKRNASEARFRAYGVVAITVGLIFLMVLFTSIIRSGLPAFSRTVIDVPFTLSEADHAAAEGELFKTKVYQGLFIAAIQKELDDKGLDAEADPEALGRLLGKLGGDIRAFYKDTPAMIGAQHRFELAASSRVDAYLNGHLTRETLVDSRFMQASDLDLVDALIDAGIIHGGFDWTFIFGADAGVDNPGGAGIGVSVVGSFFMMLVVLLLSLPIGVATAIYLEEFAPKNRLTDLIEVNISNLAAVPSIVYGILGLAIFIQFAHFPQSAPVVGGLVLTLMTLPRIIIPARAALGAVPPSIREAALGVGASRMQSVFHHVLPLAMPGILTGLIIGLGQALGETAPLLLIGMVGFVAREYPDTLMEGFLEANSAMPAQIYTWATRADSAFYDKAWGGIIILLIFLLGMNILAVILRRKFERRW